MYLFGLHISWMGLNLCRFSAGGRLLKLCLYLAVLRFSFRVGWFPPTRTAM
jgi:hypothetical protein